MVKTFVLNVNKLPDPKECPEVLFELEEKRREKILKCKNEMARKQSLGAGLLLKKCLGDRGISVNEICYGEHGKPEVEGCFFNLSHAQEMAVCVVSEGPVGCDIEKKGRYREGLAERFFTEKEISYLNQFEGDRKKEEFIRLWTLKESYIKMTGEGTHISLDRIEFIIDEEISAYRDGEQCDCCFKEYDTGEYMLTVCSMDKKFEINFENVNMI